MAVIVVGVGLLKKNITGEGEAASRVRRVRRGGSGPGC